MNWLESEDAREVEAWLFYNETRVRLGSIHLQFAENNQQARKAFQTTMKLCALYVLREVYGVKAESAFMEIFATKDEATSHSSKLGVAAR
jgi:hypothetical protein